MYACMYNIIHTHKHTGRVKAVKEAKAHERTAQSSPRELAQKKEKAKSELVLLFQVRRVCACVCLCVCVLHNAYMHNAYMHACIHKKTSTER
jgi:hypothetical protein